MLTLDSSAARWKSCQPPPGGHRGIAWESHGPLSVTGWRSGVDQGLRPAAVTGVLCLSFIWKGREKKKEKKVNFYSCCDSCLSLHLGFWQFSRPGAMLPFPCTCDWPHYTVAPSGFGATWNAPGLWSLPWIVGWDSVSIVFFAFEPRNIDSHPFSEAKQAPWQHNVVLEGLPCGIASNVVPVELIIILKNPCTSLYFIPFWEAVIICIKLVFIRAVWWFYVAGVKYLVLAAFHLNHSSHSIETSVMISSSIILQLTSESMWSHQAPSQFACLV